MTALFTDPKPSQSSNQSRKFRSLIAQFGDGYSQIAPDGINYQSDTWQLVYENLNQTDTNTVRNFFDTNGPFTSFTWTAPGDSSAKTWRMTPDGYSVVALSGSIYTINVTIMQVF